MSENKKYMIAIIVVLLFGFLFAIITSCSKDSNDDIKHVEVTKEEDLVKNKYSLYNSNLTSKDFLIKESRLLALSIGYLLPDDYDVNTIYMNNISTEDKIYLLSTLLSGSSTEACYKESFITDKLYEIYGITVTEFEPNSDYYSIKGNKLCFEAQLFNEKDLPISTGYKENGDNIFIDVDTNDIRWSFTYQKEGKNTILIYASFTEI